MEPRSPLLVRARCSDAVQLCKVAGQVASLASLETSCHPQPPMTLALQRHIPDLQLIDASRLPYPGHHRWLFPPGREEMFNG